MLDHVALQCTDLATSARFYDAVLAPLGGRRIFERDDAGPDGAVIGYGIDRPTFWLGGHRTGDGFREAHICFAAGDRAAVDAFVAAATSAGADVLHEARVRPEYHPDYYGGFVRDPDGNNVEAVCHFPARRATSSRQAHLC